MIVTSAMKQSAMGDLCDGVVSEWTPMGRVAEPAEIAGPVVFLMMPAAAYITGQILSVDGGLCVQHFAGPCVTSSL